MSETTRRTGAETKAAAQKVALALFIAQGYEATSLRQIADELGINKASLYYHFKNKEEIVASTLADRGAEAEELLRWARAQPQTPDLVERTVLRWVDALSVEKLRGIRFITANPALMRSLAASSGTQIRDNLTALAAFLAGDRTDQVRLLLIRTALLSINAATAAAAGTTMTDAEIAAAAREVSLGILARL